MMYDPVHEELRHAQVVQERYSEQLLRKPHVVGIALGYMVMGNDNAPDDDHDDDDQPRRPVGPSETKNARPNRSTERRRVSLVVMVDRPMDDENNNGIPDELEGVPVQIQYTGAFSAGFSAG